MAGATVTYKLEELTTDRPFTVRGTATTRVLALAEANTKLAMTCGTVVSASVSEELAEEDAGDPNAGTQFSDATLILQNADGKKVSIHLENISTALGSGINGQLDLDDALITAFAAAYRDGGGLGGYDPYDGFFVA